MLLTHNNIKSFAILNNNKLKRAKTHTKIISIAEIIYFFSFYYNSNNNFYKYLVKKHKLKGYKWIFCFCFFLFLFLFICLTQCPTMLIMCIDFVVIIKTLTRIPFHYMPLILSFRISDLIDY